MSEVYKTACKALVQQGPRKNQSCQREPKDNGYCIYHQRNYEHEIALKQKRNLCGMFFRGCNEERSEEDIEQKYLNCITCRNKKYRKEFPCQAPHCTFTIDKEEDKYCKKHIRNLLHDEEKTSDVRYCDIARGCFQRITSGNMCDACKQLNKEKVAPELAVLRETYHISLECSSDTILHLQQEESSISIAELWRCIQKNAYTRGLLFTLSETDFEYIIIQPCYYCGFQSTSRLNGIDRVDNNKGYLVQNCITCCKMCNVMKNMQHPLEFLDKVNAICEYYMYKHSVSESTILKWNAYLSTRKRETYKEYIMHCKRENLEFILTEREYIQLIQGICYLCGIINRINHSNGIDRFDSSIRCYSMENSRTCCGHCNVMKGIHTYSDFIHKCIQIRRYACDRSIFLAIPVYDVSKCRNESYNAEEIYTMMINGKYMNYLDWCQEKEKSPEFMSAINEIRHRDNIVEKSADIIRQLTTELEKERSRKSHADDSKKNMHCTTIYCYLTQGKKDNFLEWYESNHEKTALFDMKFVELLAKLPTASKDDGVELCRKFMYDEKNRRNSQLRREKEAKVVKYSKPSLSKLQSKMNTTPTNTIIYPLESVAQKVQLIQEQKGYTPVIIPKQWKAKQIHEVIQDSKEDLYKAYCEENNDIAENAAWPLLWSTFVSSIKGKAFEQTEEPIKAFIDTLRQLRHNQLCYDKNSSIVDKEDRQQWPTGTVVRAFLSGKLDRFKTFMETTHGEEPENPKWVKRWATFTQSLEQHRLDEEQLKILCSKFMTAQRIKRYREGKK